MACTSLTKGRGLDCSRISGGVKYVYFGVYDQFTAPIDGTGPEIRIMDMANLDGSDNLRCVARYSGAVQTGIGADIVRQS